MHARQVLQEEAISCYDSPRQRLDHKISFHLLKSTKPKILHFLPFPAKEEQPDCNLHISFNSWWKVAIYSLLERY
jgi:hypothetical protein